MYPFEPPLFYPVIFLSHHESKRHVEANLCNRYHKARGSFIDEKSSLFRLRSELTAPVSVVHADSFPKRMRGKKVDLVGLDLEDTHGFFSLSFLFISAPTSVSEWLLASPP